jgi:quinoprotein glucose dehydrogenase
VSLLVAPAAWAGPAEESRPYEPKVEPASAEGTQAIKRFRVPQGLKVELFAAEPMLANIVAFGFDEKNRVYVAETFRLGHGVTDTRGHMNWLDADLACRTVEDRVAMYRKYLGKEAESYGVAPDRVRLLEDRDGDGKADHATVFADGFRDAAVGLGAGVLARKGDVYYTCIPDLWRLRDTDGDGKADVKESLHRGYGVHVGFLGHDLHGLRMGPDGRLYFSVGDRGTNVRTKDRTVFLPDTGAVYRCNPDGSELEVFATGLRNPQELAFDEFGNLFTVDNNSDGGDRARLVHIVEGGDSGWRIGYQFIESPNSRGPWNAERLWRPLPENTAAYLLPPLTNLADGPSGLAYEPGVTLLPDRYRRHFFLADFRGSGATSGVRAFALRPKGASFELADSQEFLWGLEATDCDFGTDGALYVSDWVEGWGITGKGRLYKVFDPARATDSTVREVKTLLAEGMDSRSDDELLRLLGHADMRIRQEAQFTIAGRGRKIVGRLADLAGADRSEPRLLARIHALWALSQIGRQTPAAPEALAAVVRAAGSADPEIRAQALRVMTDLPAGVASGSEAEARIVQSLKDESPRVRFYAALAAGKRRVASAFPAVVGLLRDNADRDPYLRHAAVMALAGLADSSPARLRDAAGDGSASVRLGVLLAWRRLETPEVARFLNDPEPRLVLEAARAINDVPIDGALPKLAALGVKAGLDEPLLRRVVNANVRLGGADNAETLASLASRSDVPEAIRAEALDALADWAKPSGRDRVMGLWRPLPEQSAGPAAEALAKVVAGLLREAPERVRRSAAKAAGRLKVEGVAALLAALAADAQRPVSTRVEALKSLDGLDAVRLAEAVRATINSPEAGLRTEALRLLAGISPAEAVPALEGVLERGSTAERQGAFATLGGMGVPAADGVLSRWLDRLEGGKVPAEVQLDLLEAAAKRPSDEVKRKLDRYQAAKPKDDPLASYRETLAGGDARRGRQIFQQKAEVQCLRCHKIRGQGGEVGPDLTGIGGRQPRDYILESIVAPNRRIAQGFESIIVAKADGQVVAGIVKGEDATTLRLMTPDAQLLTIPKADIEERKAGVSAMPDDTIKHLSKEELRDLVEFLARSR